MPGFVLLLNMKMPDSESLRQNIEKEFDSGPLPKVAVLTCDIEPDFGGRTGTTELLEDPVHINKLLAWCRESEVPLTSFVTTSLLTQKLPGVHELIDKGIEMHPHSHTHDTKKNQTESAKEIAGSQEAWKFFFGENAKGYRAPQGILYPDDPKSLKENGFEFSASIFPSLRQRVFDYRSLPRTPWVWKGGVMELPFASTKDRSRLTLSTLKLRGINYWKKRISNLPKIVIIDTHLHDFASTNSFRKLPLPIKMAYSRNKTKGFESLKWLTKTLKEMGYGFMGIQEIVEAIQ